VLFAVRQIRQQVIARSKVRLAIRTPTAFRRRRRNWHDVLVKIKSGLRLPVRFKSTEFHYFSFIKFNRFRLEYKSREPC
jgi:hypothetical protein